MGPQTEHLQHRPNPSSHTFSSLLGFQKHPAMPNSVLIAQLQQAVVPYVFLALYCGSCKPSENLKSHPQLHPPRLYPVFQYRFPTISQSWQVESSSQPLDDLSRCTPDSLDILPNRHHNPAGTTVFPVRCLSHISNLYPHPILKDNPNSETL